MAEKSLPTTPLMVDQEGEVKCTMRGCKTAEWHKRISLRRAVRSGRFVPHSSPTRAPSGADPYALIVFVNIDAGNPLVSLGVRASWWPAWKVASMYAGLGAGQGRDGLASSL
jgi:hypothetical protein